MHLTYILSISYVYLTCILRVSYVYPTCILRVSYVYPTCILRVWYVLERFAGGDLSHSPESVVGRLISMDIFTNIKEVPGHEGSLAMVYCIVP